MDTRKLATIEKIKNISPIQNADAIEVAEVKGWKCVVKKGEFSKGDLIVYCEVDSILPERSEFEFLRKGCWNEKYKGFRIKTVRLRGQISQGIVFSLNILPAEIWNVPEEDLGLKVGTDVTNILGIQKYVPEIPSCLNGKVKGPFPSFIPKTNEERVQNIQKELKTFNGFECYITEKLDGTSSTFYVRDKVFGVCGRNWEYEEDDKNSYWRIAKKYNLEEKFKKLRRNIAIQGEIIGPGIQKNKYNLDEIELYVFNIMDIETRYFYSIFEMETFCKSRDLKIVPIQTTEGSVVDNVDYWVELSKGNSVLNKKIQREGIVVRNNYGYRFSFKSINPEFLLKNRE